MGRWIKSQRHEKGLAPGQPSAAIDLDGLITAFGQASEFWQSQAEPGILVRARFADACRDASVRPVTESQFLARWTPLENEVALRFCLLTVALPLPEVSQRLAEIGSKGSADDVLALLQNLAVRLKYLTIQVLRDSDLRLEEFARHYCLAWGLAIRDETAAHSAARLHAIDFGRLMQEAEAARTSAADRLAYLRKMQEEQDKTRRPRRGKW
jgi:hypothetical protein